jgi:Ner family transcriptional regulator
MSNVDTTKKPARQDWHRADIKAALEKRGWSLRRLSLSQGYEGRSLATALNTPWPRAEAIIAEQIGVPARRIWPSRYHNDGTPKSGRGERGLGRYKRKRSTARAGSNVHARGAR